MMNLIQLDPYSSTKYKIIPKPVIQIYYVTTQSWHFDAINLSELIELRPPVVIKDDQDRS